MTRGAYGFVYVSRAERRRLAALLAIPTGSFTRRYCVKAGGFFHLRDRGRDCIFLVNRRCAVYPARPGQCATWPFWPENLADGAWVPAVRRDCPGTRHGRRLSAAAVAQRVQLERDREATIWSW